MITVTVGIGNSDNKLTQQHWADYIRTVANAVQSIALETHFSGGSDPRAPWQNYCFVFQMHNYDLLRLRNLLAYLASNYHQESIALTVGDTELVKA